MNSQRPIGFGFAMLLGSMAGMQIGSLPRPQPINRRRYYPIISANDIALKHERDRLWAERNFAKPRRFLSSRKQARLDRILRRMTDGKAKAA